MSPPAQPLLTRADLRLVMTASLSAGLAVILGVREANYAPSAVAAALGGTLGASRVLGIQRMQGTVLGGLIVAILHPSLSKVLPLPLGVGLALACTRLFGGSIGLHSGYKVAGMVVSVAWLIQDNGLSTWLDGRLVTTMIGVVLAWLSVATIWPSRALSQHHQLSKQLWTNCAELMRERAQQLELGQEVKASERMAQRNRLLAMQLKLQTQRPEAELELAADQLGERLGRLWDLQEQLLLSLIASYRTLLRIPMVPMPGPSLSRLLSVEVAALRTLADRLDLWSLHWPESRWLGQRRHRENSLAGALAQLEAAEVLVFADAEANEVLIGHCGGRRAVACQQLLSCAIDFETAWAATP
jgi:hypothetical protein